MSELEDPPERGPHRRSPGDSLRPDNTTPTTAEGYHKRPSARRGEMVPAVPFAAAPANVLPWERGPRENDREWALFVAYRDSAYPLGLQGPLEPRNLARLAASLGELPNSLRDLARQYNWPWRAAHWDRDVDKRKQDLARTELERAAIDHGRIRAKVRQLAEGELDKLLQVAITSAETTVTPSELAKLLKLTHDFDRLAAGLPTGEEGESFQPNWGALNYEELKQVRDLLKKAGGQIIVQTTGEDVTRKQ